MKTIYDNSSFYNFILNEFVDIWIILSDDGRVLYNLDEITEKRLMLYWFKDVGVGSYMSFELRWCPVFGKICSLVVKFWGKLVH